MDAILNLFNTAAYCSAYSIVLAHHLKQKRIWKTGMFFFFTFALEIICDIWLTGLAPFTFYISAAFAGGLIGSEHYFVYGLHISIAALMAFQWLIALFGSLAFTLFPVLQGRLRYSLQYNLFMAAALILSSLILCRWDKLFIRQSTSRKLLKIDITLNFAFIFLLNYLLPMFFLDMGLLSYTKICILLLVVTAVYVLHRNYTASLEKKAQESDFALQMLNARAKITAEKYRELFEIKAEYKPAYTAAARYIPLIHKVEIPIIQSILYELLDETIAKGVRLNIHTNKISTVHMDLEDLFSMLSIFSKNITTAMEQMAPGQQISLWVIQEHGVFKYKITADMPSGAPAMELYGEGIAKSIAEKNRKKGIFVNVSSDGQFVQILEVANDIKND